MPRHDLKELYQWQSLPLNEKILMTKRRITEWVERYGEDGVYVSFSGGKDSTVLLTIARELFPNIKAVFVNTGLEYPEIIKFVKTFDNVDIIKPKLTFRQVIEKYGYPYISKEVSECVYGAKKYLTLLLEKVSLEQSRAEQSRAEQSRAEQSRAEQSNCHIHTSSENSLELENMKNLIQKLNVRGGITKTIFMRS